MIIFGQKSCFLGPRYRWLNLRFFFSLAQASPKKLPYHVSEHYLFMWIVLKGVICHLFLEILAKVKNILTLSHLQLVMFRIILLEFQKCIWLYCNICCILCKYISSYRKRKMGWYHDSNRRRPKTKFRKQTTPQRSEKQNFCRLQTAKIDQTSKHKVSLLGNYIFQDILLKVGFVQKVRFVFQIS